LSSDTAQPIVAGATTQAGAAVGPVQFHGARPYSRMVGDVKGVRNWVVSQVRLLRDTSLVTDACNASLALTEHHDWVPEAAKRLMIGGNILWHAVCSEWVRR
jgi:hypothetical protein